MRRVLLLVALALVAASCGAGEAVVTTVPTTPPTTSTTIPANGGDQLALLAAARQQWASSAPADYTVTERADCDGCVPEAVTLAVREGEVVSLAPGAELATVDEVFNEIERSILEGAEVDVVYDDGMGYPTRVIIDREGDGTVDVDLQLGDLEAMPIVRTYDELLVAYDRWQSLQLDTYRYILRADCTCDENGTWEIEIRDGRVHAVVALDDDAQQSSLSPGPIDEAFDDLAEWFTDSDPLIEEGILAVDVRMDPELGYPRWFRVTAADLDDESFEGPFTIVITIDLVLPYLPIDPEPKPVDDGDRAALDEALTRWRAAALADYEFEYSVHCLCTAQYVGPFLVTVRSGEAVSIDWLGGEGEGNPLFGTVWDAFDIIAAAIEEGTDVEVTYDTALGHPQMAVIDPEAVAVDGGLVFSISRIAPLEDPVPVPERAGVISATALAGPQCPVQKSPPDPDCADKPVPGADVLVTETSGDTVAKVTTGEDGTFRITLEPGTYTVVPQPVAGLLGTAPPVEAVVKAGETTTVELAYDTGIR